MTFLVWHGSWNRLSMRFLQQIFNANEVSRKLALGTIHNYEGEKL